MEPWQSWTVAAVMIGGVAYYYSTTDKQKKRINGLKQSVSKTIASGSPAQLKLAGREKHKKEKIKTQSSGAKSGKIQKQSTIETPNGDQTDGKRARDQSHKPARAGVGHEQELKQSSSEAGDDKAEDFASDLAFAQQLSNKISGTSLKRPEQAQTQPKKKAKKQAKQVFDTEVDEGFGANGTGPAATQMPALQDVSTASSTTGGDADDDLSAANSPNLQATKSSVSSAGDVSDMLEPRAKGPSILRLTEPVNPLPQRQPKVQKPGQAPETKKQRQNRKRREDEKAMREQADRERRVALEAQKRTVREAEGRPAKNGLAARAPEKQSPWNASSKPAPPITDGAGREGRPRQEQLLDTFDDSKAMNGNVDSLHDLPSEEDQMKMLSEIESDHSWNTVSKGGRSKKPNAQAASVDASSAAYDNKISVNDAGTYKRDKGQSTHSERNGVSHGREHTKTTGLASTTNGQSDIWSQPGGMTSYHANDSEWAVV